MQVLSLSSSGCSLPLLSDDKWSYHWKNPRHKKFASKRRGVDLNLGCLVCKLRKLHSNQLRYKYLRMYDTFYLFLPLSPGLTAPISYRKYEIHHLPSPSGHDRSGHLRPGYHPEPRRRQESRDQRCHCYTSRVLQESRRCTDHWPWDPPAGMS